MNSTVRPWLRRVAILACVVLVPLVVHRVWDYVELRRLTSALQAILDRGEPVSERDAGLEYQPFGTSERYAGTYYLAGATLALDDSARADRMTGLRALRDWLDGAEPAPPDRQAQLRATRDTSQEALALADAGAQLPFRGFPAGTEYNYRTAGLLDLSRLLAARTVTLSLDGDGEGAVASAISGLALGRALPYFPVFIEEGDTAAILSWSEPSSEALGRLQAALVAEDQPNRGVTAFLRARASVIDGLWRRYYGLNPNVPTLYSLPMRGVTELAQRPWVTHQFVALLHVWAEQAHAAQTPWPDRARVAEEMLRANTPPARDSWRRTRWSSYSDDLLRRAVQPDRLIVDRAALVAVAIERYRRDHGASLPPALAELVTEYLPALPMDPFTGAALRYRQTADAYVIYSIGPDGTDDGGRLLRPAPPGSLPRFVQGPDIGVRILTGREGAKLSP